MTDMLVKLYDDRDVSNDDIVKKGIKIQRALVIDQHAIRQFINEHFLQACPGWADECVSTLSRQPTSCFIAIHKKRVVGFSCYDGTAKGMVGPVGVDEKFRGLGIARVLLFECFEAMKMEGYAYAVIGWVDSIEYYEKACGAIAIPESFPGIYSRMVKHN